MLIQVYYISNCISFRWKLDIHEIGFWITCSSLITYIALYIILGKPRAKQINTQVESRVPCWLGSRKSLGGGGGGELASNDQTISLLLRRATWLAIWAFVLFNQSFLLTFLVRFISTCHSRMTPSHHLTTQLDSFLMTQSSDFGQYERKMS